MRTQTFPHTLVAALLFSTVAAAPAFAQGDINTRTVHVADLDLATPRGKAVLRDRVGRALEGVCGSYATVEPSQQDAITACRAAATAEIAAQMAARNSATALASAK